MEKAKTYERRIGRLLRIGVMTGSLFMATGLIQASLQPPQVAPEHHATLKDLLLGFMAGRLDSIAGSPAFSTLFVGLLLLMLTPYLRVLAALFAFAAEKDWRFVGVATVVLCILTGQLIYSLQ